MGGDPAHARVGNIGYTATKFENEEQLLMIGAERSAMSFSKDAADVERSLERFAEAASSSPSEDAIEVFPSKSDIQMPLSRDVLHQQGAADCAARNAVPASPKIPAELDGVLREISAVGVPYYSWGSLKELFATRITEAVGSLEKEAGFRQSTDGKNYKQRRDELVESLRKFDAAPFTLQRLAEILQDPRRQYSSTHKLINGLERLLAVSSTLPRRHREGSAPTDDTNFPRPAVLHSSNSSNGNIPAAQMGASRAAHKKAIAGSEAAAEATISIAVSVNVEARNAARVSAEEEDGGVTRVGSADSWASQETNSANGQGPGRKRLKVDVSTKEGEVMTE